MTCQTIADVSPRAGLGVRAYLAMLGLGGWAPDQGARGLLLPDVRISYDGAGAGAAVREEVAICGPDGAWTSDPNLSRYVAGAGNGGVPYWTLLIDQIEHVIDPVIPSGEGPPSGALLASMAGSVELLHRQGSGRGITYDLSGCTRSIAEHRVVTQETAADSDHVSWLHARPWRPRVPILIDLAEDELTLSYAAADSVEWRGRLYLRGVALPSSALNRTIIDPTIAGAVTAGVRTVGAPLVSQIMKYAQMRFLGLRPGSTTDED